MPITRSFQDSNRVTDWTAEVNEVPNQYGLLNSMNLFSSQGVSSTSVTFDRTEYNTTLLKQTKRGTRNATTSGDRSVDTFSIPLPFFKHDEFITVDDIHNFRMPGASGAADTLGRVVADKIERAKLRADQTHEYMKVQAIKGITKDPDGVELFNGFTEFGLGAQKTVAFALGTASTMVDDRIRELKTKVAKNAKAGSRIGRMIVLTDPSFFDKLVTHVSIRDAYKFYQNTGRQALRDDLSRYESYGVVDTFEHRGVLFMSYDATFDMPDGSPEEAFSTDEGFSVVEGIRDSYRGYFGPSDKLSGANQVGSENYAFEYRDQRDENHLIQIETAPLYFMAKPQLSVKCTTN